MPRGRSNCRKMPRSHDVTPGPRSTLNGAVPNRASVTGTNASGSKYALFGPIPPRIFTSDFTWSAR